jgi:hypothetical protein
MSIPLDAATRARLAQDFNTESAPVTTPSAFESQIGGGHYKSLSIQPALFSEANGLSFLEGSIVKRICRHRSKNGSEDIRKAIHELTLLLEITYGERP